MKVLARRVVAHWFEDLFSGYAPGAFDGIGRCPPI